MMRYAIDLSELTLLELLDLTAQELFGLVRLDESNARALRGAVEVREDMVEALEKSLKAGPADPPGSVVDTRRC